MSRPLKIEIRDEENWKVAGEIELRGTEKDGSQAACCLEYNMDYAEETEEGEEEEEEKKENEKQEEKPNLKTPKNFEDKLAKFTANTTAQK